MGLIHGGGKLKLCVFFKLKINSYVIQNMLSLIFKIGNGKELLFLTSN
jgi:hypothetical protein